MAAPPLKGRTPYCAFMYICVGCFVFGGLHLQWGDFIGELIPPQKNSIHTDARPGLRWMELMFILSQNNHHPPWISTYERTGPVYGNASLQASTFKIARAPNILMVR